MNKYESVIIVDSSLTKEEFDAVVNKITTFLNEEGEVTKVEDIGIKKLAYEIDKMKEGHYVLLEFKAERETIAELERIYRITDEIKKFLTMLIED